MQLADFHFGCPLRVRWSEADPQGIVFNGHYLNYADVGVTEYYRALNAANPGREDLSGNEFFAVKTLLEYRSSAFFDDLLDVRLRVSRLGNSSMSFTLGIFRDEELLVTGEIVYVRADQQTRKPLPIPEEFKAAVRAFEQVAPQETSAAGA
ncbi:thioesterase family protein [uncultured Pseudomonas sp.]|uniref:acyl-CoA thioesterase n=1 Tax=uncultured Pseudomonas sp. TaxID=114707 RepID=UPI0030DAEEE7|tara:strand:- start:6715 stop:7167 length:453 start_codon:yes stop_codon:yes gene_type:complete